MRDADDAESAISSPIAPISLARMIGSTITAPLMPTKLFGVAVGGDGDCGPLWMAIRAAREARYCFADRMTSENSLSNCYFEADDARSREGREGSQQALLH